MSHNDFILIFVTIFYTELLWQSKAFTSNFLFSALYKTTSELYDPGFNNPEYFLAIVIKLTQEDIN